MFVMSCPPLLRPPGLSYGFLPVFRKCDILNLKGGIVL
nr:MAG TPA: hypothetical protein [Caudoviricetes sp.]